MGDPFDTCLSCLTQVIRTLVVYILMCLKRKGAYKHLLTINFQTLKFPLQKCYFSLQILNANSFEKLIVEIL